MQRADVGKMVAHMKKSGRFRSVLKQKARVDTLAHLICETRQAVLAGRKRDEREVDLQHVENLMRKKRRIMQPPPPVVNGNSDESEISHVQKSASQVATNSAA